jgi:hypothetical protein
MFGIGRDYSIRKHSFIVILKTVISVSYCTGRSANDRIFQSPVDRPWQSQVYGIWSALFILSTGDSYKSNSTVFIQLRSILEPLWGIEIGKNRCRTNEPDAWKLTPIFYDRIFAGIRAELPLRYLNLLFGGIVADL